MISKVDEILPQPCGAQFFRADLHIHSYGSSHDVDEAAMTSDGIIATAIREGLSLISITDHNDIRNVHAAVEAAKDKNIFVVPGVELSTSQGHLLCYLPTATLLSRFFGQLSIADHGLPTSRCQKSILECLNLLLPLGGFAILAHVDAPGGFEVEVPGASPHKLDVLCHPALLGIELKRAASAISYAPNEFDSGRAAIGRERIKRLNLGTSQILARVLNSDAHTLEALGRNAENARKVTRYKMDRPSFEALRIALADADARVRIEDQIPQTIPRIMGIQMMGGFLAGQSIHFSRNLNCIIGGRGTGKSTTFEAVRCLATGTSDSKVVDSEVWPEELHLFWEDPAGQRHTLYRPKGGEIQNIDTPETGPHSFEIDCFGQGDAAKISLQAQSNPLALLHYLDRFVDLREAIAEEESAREELLTLQTEIEKAEQKAQLIPQYENLLATVKKQLAALQKPDVKELIDLQRKIATEREIRNQIVAKLQDIKRELGRSSPKSTAEQIRTLADPTHLKLGSVEFQAIATGASALEQIIEGGETKIREGLTTFEELINRQFVGWKIKEADAQKQIDEKRRELEALNVSFDMSYINKLAADEASHAQSVANLKTWVPHLANLRQQRAKALSRRWVARARVSTLRDIFGKTASAILREALSDIQVSLKYSRNAHSPDAADLIIEAMGWKTNQQARAAWLVNTLTIPTLLEAVQKQNSASILGLKTPEGIAVFRADEAKTILERLAQPEIKFALERVALHDLPRLQITGEVTDKDGKKRYVQRDFAKLSLGQQQSVLLALMLSSNSNRPLIIDQPEDNLDGEFIYMTLVPVLRRAKERRQVIIVTHNANVAVLGDAEQIIVMKALNDRGTIVARGSIDHPETRDAACAILEGAQEAFIRRAKMYGVNIQ